MKALNCVYLSSLLILFLSLEAVDFYKGEVSNNFVIRWAFQDLCDHHFDPRWVWPSKRGEAVSFNVRDVKPGDLIFVRDFKYFFKHKHKYISVPYFILTHGEYLDMFKEEYLDYLDDDMILGWFTIHPCDIEHERVIPLPLGVAQFKELYDKKNGVMKKFLKMRQYTKDKLVYMNFTDWRNPERTRIMNLFLQKGFCTYGQPCPFKTYIDELAQHKFVISPPGLGPDCYRVWESLLVGTIPIVQHSHMDRMYAGLPVLLIDTWEEVTEDFLEQKYKEITAKKYSQKKLYMEHWCDIIAQTRKKYWPIS